MNKTCTICKKKKKLENFNKKSSTKDGLQNVCKECNRAKSRAYYKKNCVQQRKQINALRKIRQQKRSEFIRKYKVFCGCKFCQEKEYVALDFHHLYDKQFLISRMAHDCKTMKDIKKEIRKCVVLCANCHRKLHAGLISL